MDFNFSIFIRIQQCDCSIADFILIWKGKCDRLFEKTVVFIQRKIDIFITAGRSFIKTVEYRMMPGYLRDICGRKLNGNKSVLLEVKDKIRLKVRILPQFPLLLFLLFIPAVSNAGALMLRDTQFQIRKPEIKFALIFSF